MQFVIPDCQEKLKGEIVKTGNIKSLFLKQCKERLQLMDFCSKPFIGLQLSAERLGILTSLCLQNFANSVYDLKYRNASG